MCARAQRHLTHGGPTVARPCGVEGWDGSTSIHCKTPKSSGILSVLTKLGTPGWIPWGRQGGHLPLADRPVCLPTARVQLDVMCRRSATFPSRSGPDLRKAGRTRRRLGTAPNDAATLGTPTTRQHRQDVTAADTLFTQQPGRAHTARHAANRPRAKTKDGRSHHLQGRIDWTLTAAY